MQLRLSRVSSNVPNILDPLRFYKKNIPIGSMVYLPSRMVDFYGFHGQKSNKSTRLPDPTTPKQNTLCENSWGTVFWCILPSRGFVTYPTEREVRKIIDSKCHFWGGYVSSLEGNMYNVFFLKKELEAPVGIGIPTFNNVCYIFPNKIFWDPGSSTYRRFKLEALETSSQSFQPRSFL